jgi:hypothetical protein
VGSMEATGTVRRMVRCILEDVMALVEFAQTGPNIVRYRYTIGLAREGPLVSGWRQRKAEHGLKILKARWDKVAAAWIACRHPSAMRDYHPLYRSRKSQQLPLLEYPPYKADQDQDVHRIRFEYLKGHEELSMAVRQLDETEGWCEFFPRNSKYSDLYFAVRRGRLWLSSRRVMKSDWIALIDSELKVLQQEPRRGQV